MGQAAPFSGGRNVKESVSSAHRPVPRDALSVVVIPLLGGEPLAACLAALKQQPLKQLLVVARDLLDAPAPVKVLVATRGASVPERRMIGLKAAATPFVAFIEDTCVPQPHWTAALCEPFRVSDVRAVGGPVLINVALTPRFRALAISEYCHFPSGCGEQSEVEALPGANFAIRADALDGMALPSGLVDNLVFSAVRKAGGRCIFNPRASVTYTAGPPAHARLSTRFHHGRIYGGLLVAKRPLPSRFLLALTAIASPAVLIARNLRHAGLQLLSSPATLLWTVLMQVAWGCGEVVGKLTGKAGASLKVWS